MLTGALGLLSRRRGRICFRRSGMRHFSGKIDANRAGKAQPAEVSRDRRGSEYCQSAACRAYLARRFRDGAHADVRPRRRARHCKAIVVGYKSAQSSARHGHPQSKDSAMTFRFSPFPGPASSGRPPRRHPGAARGGRRHRCTRKSQGPGGGQGQRHRNPPERPRSRRAGGRSAPAHATPPRRTTWSSSWPT